MMNESAFFARKDLANAYQMIALLGWDDSTYTHLTIRHPEKDHFFILKFGLFFEEASPDNLLEVDFKGNLIGDPSGDSFNPTGYAIHSSLYTARPEINAIFHLHTPAGIAVSADPRGILPISQHAYHFYEAVSYFDYDSLTLHKETQGQAVAQHIESHHPIMMLKNHGTIVCGKTIQEAFFFQYHLERACQIQCLFQNHTQYEAPSHEVCLKAREDILNFEKNLGARDWKAFLRKLQREGRPCWP